MAYATVEDARGYLKGVDLSALGDTTAQDDVISDALNLATARVERKTRRKFTSVTETRTFDGMGSVRLPVPDLLAVTGWSVDGAAQDTAGLVRYPLNSTPTLWLLLKSGCFALGEGNVTVTGTWGYAASVPADVVSATAMLTAADVLSRVAAGKDAGTTAVSQGGLSEKYDGGAFEAAIRRLEGSAEGLVSGFRRPVV